MSRTLTTPRLTLVSVPSHSSCTSQIVPRTVAALYLPSVRNLPFPLPHSLPRTDFGPFFLVAASVADRAPFSGAHCERATSPFSTRSVTSALGFFGFFLGTLCLTWKMPL